MLNKVIKTIDNYHMINDKETVIIGVSGGMDSMCLLNVLYQLKSWYVIRMHAVHIHHGIRGKDADEDARFVSKFCKRLHIPCDIFYFNVKEEAAVHKVSEEEMGRNIRYKMFDKVSQQYLRPKIAVAHHENDVAETILFNLMRGTGLKGMSGIRAVRGNVVRPLIECSRKEIESYCCNKKIPYREDYTNTVNIYSRNKIRNHLIPYIEENFNANWISTISQTARIIRDEDEYLGSIANTYKNQCVSVNDMNDYLIDLDKFRPLDSVIKKRIIRKVLVDMEVGLKDFEHKHIESIIKLEEKKVSKLIHLPKGMSAKRDYTHIIIMPKRDRVSSLTSFKYTVDIPSNLYLKELNETISFKLMDKKSDAFPKKMYTKWFDYDKIENNLEVRTRMAGDFIYLKDTGKKKLKDYFIDAKIPRDIRGAIPLLTDGSNVIWIVGYRMNEYYKISKSTYKILEVCFC